MPGLLTLDSDSPQSSAYITRPRPVKRKVIQTDQRPSRVPTSQAELASLDPWVKRKLTPSLDRPLTQIEHAILAPGTDGLRIIRGPSLTEQCNVNDSSFHNSMGFSTPGFPEDDSLAVWPPKPDQETTNPKSEKYRRGIPGRDNQELAHLKKLEPVLGEKTFRAIDSFTQNFLETLPLEDRDDAFVPYSIYDLQSDLVDEEYRLTAAEGKTIEETMFTGSRAHLYGAIGETPTVFALCNELAQAVIPYENHNEFSVSPNLHPCIKASAALRASVAEPDSQRSLAWVQTGMEHDLPMKDVRWVAGRILERRTDYRFSSFTTKDMQYSLNEGTAHYAEAFMEAVDREKEEAIKKALFEAAANGDTEEEAQSEAGTTPIAASWVAPSQVKDTDMTTTNSKAQQSNFQATALSENSETSSTMLFDTVTTTSPKRPKVTVQTSSASDTPVLSPGSSPTLSSSNSSPTTPTWESRAPLDGKVEFDNDVASSPTTTMGEGNIIPVTVAPDVGPLSEFGFATTSGSMGGLKGFTTTVAAH